MVEPSGGPGFFLGAAGAASADRGSRVDKIARRRRREVYYHERPQEAQIAAYNVSGRAR